MTAPQIFFLLHAAGGTDPFLGRFLTFLGLPEFASAATRAFSATKAHPVTRQRDGSKTAAGSRL